MTPNRVVSRRHLLRRLLGWLALTVVGLAGCGPSKPYPVRGQVLLRETLRPLKEGQVRFRSVSNPALVGSGRIGADGVFSLRTPGGEGLPTGQYRAAVTVPPRGGKPIIHPRYAEFDTSDLLYTVEAREENYFLLEVSGKPE